MRTRTRHRQGPTATGRRLTHRRGDLGSALAPRGASSPSLGDAGRGLAAVRPPCGVSPGRAAARSPVARPHREQVRVTPLPLCLHADRPPQTPESSPLGYRNLLFQLDNPRKPRSPPTDRQRARAARGRPPNPKRSPLPSLLLSCATIWYPLPTNVWGLCFGGRVG